MPPAGTPRAGDLPSPVEGAYVVRTVRQPRGTLTSTRSKARRAALELLFEADQRNLNAGELLASRVERPVREAPLREYTREIVGGVVAHWNELDEVLATYSRGWPLQRMPAVDRSILRVAAWEILHNDDVPDAVAVSEAVDLATSLSTDESPSFVNGLLSRIAEVAHPAADPTSEAETPATTVEADTQAPRQGPPAQTKTPQDPGETTS